MTCVVASLNEHVHGNFPEVSLEELKEVDVGIFYISLGEGAAI